MVKSAYIHIPFCVSICSYCDFCKLYYHKKWVEKYLTELKKEIKKSYQGEVLDTLYIGGGTPSALSLEELEQLFSILQIFQKSPTCEFTVEANPDTLTEEKLLLFHKMGVNRISLGVETIHPRLQKMMERTHTKEEIKSLIQKIKEVGITNLNVDLMYALPSETKKELQEDLNFLLTLEVPHISTYSLILEPHTKMYLQYSSEIDEDLDADMYEIIKQTLKKHGYIHYETSNFCKEGFSSRHNLTYWNNQEYYGFGLGSSGYIQNVRYENTRSLSHYLEGNYLLESHTLTKLEDMQNFFLLGLRKMEGVKKKDFVIKYGCEAKEIFPVIEKLIEEGKIEETEDSYFIKEEYSYLANEVLVSFI